VARCGSHLSVNLFALAAHRPPLLALPQPLLAPGAGFDWHDALAAGICLSAKFLYEEKIFASDFVASFTGVSSSAELIRLKARALALWLPNIAHIHDLALACRTSLLDLVLDHHSRSSFAWGAGSNPNRKRFNILIVEEDVALHAQHEAAARAVAPNATIFSSGCYMKARAHVVAQEEAGTPVHLVLAGACADDVSAEVKVLGAVAYLLDAIDPRKGDFHSDMRGRPLIAAVSGCAQWPGGLSTNLHDVGIDAVLPGGPVILASLHILLDFVCEHDVELTAAPPPSEEPSSLAAALAPTHYELTVASTPVAPHLHRTRVAAVVSAPRSAAGPRSGSAAPSTLLTTRTRRGAFRAFTSDKMRRTLSSLRPRVRV